MDWIIDRPSKRERLHQAKWHEGRKRLVVDFRCAVCNARLMKQSYFVTPEEYLEYQPQLEKAYEVGQYCAECK